MSHLLIDWERVEKSDSEFYASTPTLEGYAFTLTREGEPDPFVIDHPELSGFFEGGQRRLLLTVAVISRFKRQYAASTRASWPHVGYKPFDAKPDDPYQLSELVSPNKSYSRDVTRDAPSEHGAAEQNQAIVALLALEFDDPDDEDQFPHSALRSFSQDEGADIERILAEGTPDWVRELRRQLRR